MSAPKKLILNYEPAGGEAITFLDLKRLSTGALLCMIVDASVAISQKEGTSPPDVLLRLVANYYESVAEEEEAARAARDN